ncbi:MAG: plasmid pRiA4b ORF-3 family protein [Deltaproteobacteria bacterium]|nr:plasmid pRiA4b ORF-3 family protein [Deltaproteobacteria bacterium]
MALVSVIQRLGMTADQRARVSASWRSQKDPLSSKSLTLLDVLLTDGSAEALQLASSLSAAQARAWIDAGSFRLHVLDGQRAVTFQKVFDACLDRAETRDPPKQRPPAPVGLHRYYRVTATLQDAPQRTMRQFLLADDATWDDLHDAIQDASDSWERGHMWAIVQGKSRTMLADGDGDGVAGADGQIADQVDVGQRQFVYKYDFGDNWRVAVTVAAKPELLAQDCRRLLVSGQGAFPPEDCGGIGGMYRLTEKFRASAGNFEGEEYEEDWRWDPDAFDFDAVKAGFDRPRR